MAKKMLAFLFWITGAMIQQSLATNCTELPKAIAPETCCDFPRLFKTNVIYLCSPRLSRGQQCVLECIYSATELCLSRRCKVHKAESYVDWVNLEIDDFNPVYKQAYRECMNEISELDNSHFKDEECDPQPQLIEICVHKKMFTLCPDKYYHLDIPECVEQREFLTNCVKT